MEKASHIFVKDNELEWENVGEGVDRKILGYNGDLMMVRVRFEKGAIGAAHSHPHRQVTFVEAGKFTVDIGEEKSELQAGDSFIVPADAVHGVVAEEAGILIDVFTPQREDFLK